MNDETPALGARLFSSFIIHRSSFTRIAFPLPFWHPIAVVVEVQGLTFRTIHLPNDAALVARNRRDACVETFGDERQFEGDIRYLAWLKEKGGLTLHDLAAEFKVSAERIRQIEVKALEKMRKVIGPMVA